MKKLIIINGTMGIGTQLIVYTWMDYLFIAENNVYEVKR